MGRPKLLKQCSPPAPGTDFLFSGGIHTQIERCSYYETFELEWSSYFLIWAATDSPLPRYLTKKASAIKSNNAKLASKKPKEGNPVLLHGLDLEKINLEDDTAGRLWLPATTGRAIMKLMKKMDLTKWRPDSQDARQGQDRMVENDSVTNTRIVQVGNSNCIYNMGTIFWNTEA
jgi:hypothetical protein